MPLETGDYICDLVPTNPLGSDNVSQGDDHIRLCKKILLQSFPAICGPVTATHEELSNAGKSLMPIVTTYTTVAAAQTHTFTAGRTWYKVIVTGGGAGGENIGGLNSNAGGAGGTAIKVAAITSADATYTVGAGGTYGNAGEASSFADGTETITGGGGADPSIRPQSGGVATGGDTNIRGGFGSTDVSGGSYWAGGSTIYSLDPAASPGLYGIGGAGDAPGGGGGSAGYPGIVVIEEY